MIMIIIIIIIIIIVTIIILIIINIIIWCVYFVSAHRHVATIIITLFSLVVACIL